MGSLSKGMKLIGRNAIASKRLAKGRNAPGYDGSSGKKFKGSTQYTGLSTLPVGQGDINNPRPKTPTTGPGRPGRPRTGPARTALSR